MVEIDPAGAVRGATIVDRQLDKVSKGAIGATAATRTFNTGLKTLGATAGALVAAMGPLAAIFAGFTVITEATGSIADFEEKMARLQGISGATGDSLDMLRETARETGAVTRFSAAEAAEGLEFLALAGFNVEESVAALPSTLNLATVGAIDLGQAADFASNILGQFNLDATETERVVDTLTSTSQSSNTSVLQLAEAMKFTGTVAGAMNIEIEETSAALGVLGDRGIQGSVGGVALRQVMLTLLDPVKEARQRILDLGVSMEEVDPTANTLVEIFSRLRDANLSVADATTIFGSKQAAGALTLIDGVEKIESLTAANKEAEGASQAFADTMGDTLKGATLSLGSAMQELFLQAGDAGVLGVLRGLVDITTDVVRALGGQRASISGINDTVDYTIAFVQELSDALIVSYEVARDEWVMPFVEVVTSGFGSVTGFLSEWSGKALDFLQRPAEIGFNIWKTVINGIIGLVRTNMQTFQMFATAVAESAKTAGKAIEALFDRDFTRAADLAEESILSLSEGFADAFKTMPDRLLENLDEDYVGNVVDFAKDVGSEYAENFAAGIEGAFDGGDTDFFANVTANVAARRAAREEREAAREAEREAREAEAEARRAALEADRDATRAAELAAIRIQNAESRQSGSTIVNSDVMGPTMPGRVDFERNSDVLRALDDEIALLGLSNQARERAIQLTNLRSEAEEEYGIRLEENDPIIEKFKEKLVALQEERQLLQFADDIGNSFASGFGEIILGAETAGEAMRGFLQEIQRLALQQFALAPLAQGISSLSSSFFGALTAGLSGTGSLSGVPTVPVAKGGMFSNGDIVPFAKGGFIDNTTIFPLRGGKIGMAGERGREVAMPTRMSNGDMGVRVEGGGSSSVVNFNIQTQNMDGAERSAAQMARRFRR